ncbi:outer membrane beta-barrel protein [Sphingobacterium oryzagri]|uniref:Outer membrane beta-barrel protein n=1 Tax=Sphingobacterium oryzagri TaxID=3025669 RepID=A0ABY7WFQ6_9SPHI|nr:outer membrane beta-barrel protein [Sphingobacterium sp. KACC 22765]WDF67449.1 outer membrane beta-barrel protein [Sphingobacterium sp. KACC 22765]
MKNILYTSVLILCFCGAAKAQEYGFKKGDFLIEGSFRASSDEGGMQNYDKVVSLSFNPQIGYFLSDKWAVGLMGGYGKQTYESKPTATSVSLGQEFFTLGAFGRYYFLDLGSRFKIFTGLESTYQKLDVLKDENFPYTGGYDQKQFGANAGIGANFFITKNLSIAYTFTHVLGFTTYKINSENSGTSFYLNANNFGNIFNTGSFSLGFRF